MENIYKVAATTTLIAGAVFTGFTPSLAAATTPVVAAAPASNGQEIELPTQVTGTDYATTWFTAEDDAVIAA